MDKREDNKYQIQNKGPMQGQVVGDNAQVHMHFHGSSNVSPCPPLPERVHNIPYPPNPYFTGREKLLSQLEATLQTGQTAALSQPQAISGLGGIGKTQIALAYAYRHLQDYQAILWSRAETTEALISGFVSFAELLQLPQKDEKDQLIVVEAVKTWLKTYDQWLLILDNADELATVRDFLPPVGRGHILLTTRAASTGRLANRLEVEILDPDVGALFVLRRARMLALDASLDQAASHDVALAQELVQEMGGLPLALDQAGAYIEETQCHLSDYLKLYRQYRATLLKERGGLVSDHPEPVTTTWSLSFEKIEQDHPGAADLLRVCAFLQANAIPEEILLEGAQHLGQEIQHLSANPLVFDKALKALLSYSLIQRNPTAHLLSVHRLVQAVIRDMMGKQTYRLWAERTIQAVEEVLPKIDHRTKQRYERCLSHALGCVEFIEQLELTSPSAVRLLSRTASYLSEHARYVEAEPLYQQALQICEQALGPEHPQVASPLNNLANLYSKQGRYVEAELLYQRALQIWEQALGPEHPNVASPLNNLANLYYLQGKYVEAEPLYQQALQIREQALGPEHPQVASPLNNLASLYSEQGRYVEAELLYQRALQIWEQALGPEHPDVASPLSGLANLYREHARYVEAELLYQRALQIWEQALGPEHPNVASPLNGLANLYREQGKYVEAKPLYQRALQIHKQALGSEHPQVASPLSGLASLYYLQGKYVEAEPLYQRALQIREQALGPEHPDVAYSLNGLANLYREQGKYVEAEPLYQRALQIHEQALGPEHPDVASPLDGFASLYRGQGKYVEAESLYQRALQIRGQALGPEHPLTQEVSKNYAALRLVMEHEEPKPPT
jgi:tetratricopeptide (TPR) repeat protein